MKNYYEILEVNENSTYDEIKKSYQNLVLKYHPDKNINIKSTEKFMLIDEAWKVLRDPSARKIYDAERMQSRFNEDPIVYDKLKLDDFSYDEENEEYFYLCRCGGVYIVPDEATNEKDNCYISCDECSLVIQLLKNNN